MGASLSDMMDRVTALEQSQQEYKKLQHRCQDLDNRSSRQNLRLIGIKGVEGANLIRFLTEFFPALLGTDNFSSPVVMDWAHCTLTLKPTNGERPQAILVRLHYYMDKQKILDLGKAKGHLLYGGDQVHIFPDMSLEVGRQRAAFNPLKRKGDAQLILPCQTCHHHGRGETLL